MKQLCSALFLCLTCAVKAQGFMPSQYTVSAAYGTTGMTVQFLNNNDEFMPITDIHSAGPFFVKMEYAIDPHFGIGLNFSMERDALYYYNPNPFYGGDSFYIQGPATIYGLNFLARVNYHFLQTRKLDPYLGAALGYRKPLGREIYLKSDGLIDYYDNNTFGGELTAGIRYFICPSIAIYAEGGIGMSEGQAGIVYRFPVKTNYMNTDPKF